MLNKVENEAGIPTDPREKLRSALSSLLPCNAQFVEWVIDFQGRLTRKTKEQKLAALNSLTELVDIATYPTALKRQEERKSAERVDLMQILEPFSDRERVIIAQNLKTMQMTDGCTVGCAWCGAEAKRGVRKAFSAESYRKFIEEFGKYFPKGREIFSGLYYDSDPFDWVSEDGKYDYSDLASFFLKKTKSPLFTSTAVPEGSELSVAEFLMRYCLRTFETVKDGKEVADSFRFSRTKDNKERIDKIMQFLKNLNFVPEAFLRGIIGIEDRNEDIRSCDIENPEDEETGIVRGGVKRIGYFVYKEDRDENTIDGINCMDTVKISPFYSRTIRGKKVEFGGVTAVSAEAVTLMNSRGEKRVPVVSGIMKIPQYIDLPQYEYSYRGQSREKKGYFPILPKHVYRIYENGKFKGTIVEESVGRDALAFYYAYLNLEDWEITVKGEENLDSAPTDSKQFFKDLGKFIIRYRKRKKSCMALFDTEQDKEAVGMAERYAQRIDDWILNLEKLTKSAQLPVGPQSSS